MAKTTVVGNAVVITSALKKEELDLIAKHNKGALTLKGGEDNKEVIFMISTGGKGGINEFSVTFDGTTHGADKLATLTMSLPANCGDVKEYIADTYGTALMNLNKLEATLPAVLENIKAQKNTVMDSITIAG